MQRLFTRVSTRQGLLLAGATGAVGSLALFSRKLLAEQKGLNPGEFIPLVVESVENVNHNTHHLRFKFANKDDESGMQMTSCVITKADINGEPVVRPYTPVNYVTDKGYLDFVIKEYPNGKMSKHIASLKPGDSLLIKGPVPKYPYKANSKEVIGLIAGGTGITPCYQLIKHVLNDPNDKTKLRLMYSNMTKEDILLREELDALQRKHPDRFEIMYNLTREKPTSLNWSNVTQFKKEHIERFILANKTPSDKHLIMVCGPPKFMESISGEPFMVNGKKEQGPLKGLLKEVGMKEENVFKF